MDKTISINIAGSLFNIDEEAFRILRDYLQSLNNRLKNVQGGLETIEDIESRIAEIFLSQKGLAGIISKDNVEAMISIIGKPEDFDIEQPIEEQQFKTGQKKRMYRNPDDKIIGGVCSGIGAYLDIDPVLFRILFVLFTAFFGTGILLYIILWIALPEANNDSRKREMYGSSYHSATSGSMQPGTSALGNAFNEIFRAVGKVLYVIMRIFMIAIGIIFVLTGALAILALLMIFVFKFPWSFSTDTYSSALTYLPDFLNYVVNPSLTPWIIGLSSMAIAIPMIAFIYWGVKMIFWFKAKDGIYSLIGSVAWVVIITALIIILANEGMSFSETSRTSSQMILPKQVDTLFVTTDHKIADLRCNKRFAMPDDNYMFLADSTDKIYITPDLKITVSNNNTAGVEIRKSSTGRNRSEAAIRSESLIYNYRLSNDTLYLDEYFSIPAGVKWRADFVRINLTVPDKTILYFDPSVEKLFHNTIDITTIEGDSIYHSGVDYDTEPWELGNKFWSVSEDGLKEVGKNSSSQK